MVSPSRMRSKSSSRRLLRMIGNSKRRCVAILVGAVFVMYMVSSVSFNSSASSSLVKSSSSSTSTSTSSRHSNNDGTKKATSSTMVDVNVNSTISQMAQSSESYLSSNVDQLCPSSKNGKSSSSDPYQLALSHSFGFFNDVPCQTWNRMRQITTKNIKHAYPAQPLYRINIPHSWYQMNYEPNFSCQFEQRIGGNGNGDGPKWICDPHRLIGISKERKKKDAASKEANKTGKSVAIAGDNTNDNHNTATNRKPGCVIYSIGSNGDFQFEEGVQQLLGPETCEIHIFDMGDYENTMPTGLNLHFHNWGITNSASLNKGSKPSQAFYEGSLRKKFSRWFGFRQEVFKSFEETVKLLGHDTLPAIDILKIDCEGCEWDVYKDWFSPNIPTIGQVLVEVHRSPQDKVMNFFDEMYDEGYVTFHKEFNTQYARGNCVEYAFMKLDKDYFDY